MVPHNVEGFFLIMGDHLAKSGDLDTARNLYENAVDLDGEQTWPHRALAEQRLVDLAELPAWFSVEADESQQADPERVPIFGGPYGCTVCHQGVVR